MFNRFLPAVAVGFALVVGAANTADAATKEEIKELKGTIKMLAKEVKTYDKLVASYTKAVAAGKDTAKSNTAIIEITKRNLGWLRNAKEVDEKTELTDDNKWYIEFRDCLKEVKHNENKAERTQHMNTLSGMLKTRLERHEKKLEKMSA